MVTRDRMDAIVAASYKVWRLGKKEGARACWKVPEVRPTWERRWKEQYDRYVETIINGSKIRNNPPE